MREPSPAGVGGFDGAPPRLRALVGEALGDAAACPTAEACLAAGERMLGRALAGDPKSRGTALDLLAADALVTRAFELAAERPDELDAMADGAMQRIAAAADAAADAAAGGSR